jgi:hypothetical protein
MNQPVPLWLNHTPGVDKVPDALNLVIGLSGRPRRRRRPALARELREARKVGLNVRRAEIEESGKITLTFGEPREQPVMTPLEQWRAKRRGQS